jgi:predicted deacylase
MAGVHGTEYTSIEAVRTFARNLDLATLARRITAAPVVNQTTTPKSRRSVGHRLKSPPAVAGPYALQEAWRWAGAPPTDAVTLDEYH